MSFEYKTVGAPEKGKRKRGARTASQRAAAAFDEILMAEATGGWEYLRTDILPLIERHGWFGRSRESHRAVMVFRRTLERAEPDGAQATPAQPSWARPSRPEPSLPGPSLPALNLTAPSLTAPGLTAPGLTEPAQAEPAEDAVLELRSATARPREPEISADPDLRLAEVVRGPGGSRLDKN